MKRRKRKIDQLVDQAAEKLGSMARLFLEAGKSAFGKWLDAGTVKAALARYVEHGSLAKWVREFVFKRTYLRVPA